MKVNLTCEHQWLSTDNDYHRCQRCLNRQLHVWRYTDSEIKEEEVHGGQKEGGGYFDVVYEIKKYTCEECGAGKEEKKEIRRGVHRPV